MWVRMPRVMLAKVAEALALRKAFPYDPEQRQGIGADVYTADEMAQAGGPQAPAPVQPTVRERLSAQRAAIAPEAPTDDMADVAEAIFAEVAVDTAPEPSVAPGASVGRCDSPSPYSPDSETCAREAGHEGLCRNHARESWERPS